MREAHADAEIATKNLEESISGTLILRNIQRQPAAARVLKCRDGTDEGAA